MKSPQRKVSRMKYCPNMHDGGMPSATVDLPQPPSYNKFGTNSVLSWFTTLLLLEDKFSKIWQSNEFQIARITVRKVWASRPFCSFVLYVPTESVKRVIPMGREWPAKIICSAVRRNISPQRSRNLWKALSTDSVQSMMVVALLRIRKHRLSHDIYALRRVALRRRWGRTIGEITISQAATIANPKKGPLWGEGWKKLQQMAK